jgi:hypothetical protein
MQDLSLRKRGRPSLLTVDWQAQLYSKHGASPLQSERTEQSLFKSSHCHACKPHLRVLLPSSIQSEDTLRCKLCAYDDDLERRHLARPSSHERAVFELLDSYPWIGGPQHYATEVAAFHKVRGVRVCMRACRADAAFFNSCVVTATCLKAGFLLFIDGELHFPWVYKEEDCQGRRNAAKQSTKDARICREAAKAGFRVLRLCWSDIGDALPMLNQAWQLCANTAAGQGWTVVSRAWNCGTHHELERLA